MTRELGNDTRVRRAEPSVFPCGQPHSEHRSVHAALDVDVAAMFAHDAPADGESEASALVLVLGGEEGFEDAR